MTSNVKGLDIAYNTLRGNLYDDLTGGLREVHLEFVAKAGRRGYPACIQFHSVMSVGDRVGIEEAQYDLANKAIMWSDNGFYASLASGSWREYLKELVNLFVARYGYQYVVFGEPGFKVDIPGSNDRFYARFASENPDVRYPVKRDETVEYLRLQQAKADLVLDFFREMVSYAQSVEAGRVGIVTCPFIPVAENSAEGTLGSSCNIAQIAEIPGVDMLVTDLKLGDVCSGRVRLDDLLRKSPRLHYVETLACALGKDVIVAGDSVNADFPSAFDEPYRDAMLCSLAASPSGFALRSRRDDRGHVRTPGKGGRLHKPSGRTCITRSFCLFIQRNAAR